jgi:hypothetical protein
VYPDILDHLRQNRAKYVRDVLIMLRAYIAAGKPSQNVRLGSYEDWARLVPSALKWLGEPDVTVTRKYFTTTVGSDRSRLNALLTAWVANYGSQPMLARTVIEDVERAYEETAKDLADALGRFAWGGKELTSKTLGSNLATYKSRNVDGMRIASQYDKHAKVERWYVEHVPATPSPEPATPNLEPPTPSPEPATLSPKPGLPLSTPPAVTEAPPDLATTTEKEIAAWCAAHPEKVEQWLASLSAKQVTDTLGEDDEHTEPVNNDEGQDPCDGSEVQSSAWEVEV